MSIYRGETQQRLFEVWKLSSGNIRKVWATFVGERQWGSNLNVGMHRAIQRRDLQEQSSGHRGVFSPQMHECLRTPLLFFLLSDPCVMSIVWIIYISHSQRTVSSVLPNCTSWVPKSDPQANEFYHGDFYQTVQGCTTCGGLAARLWENGKKMRKWRGNGEEMERKWTKNEKLERYLLSTFSHFIFISSLSIHFQIKNCFISQNK